MAPSRKWWAARVVAATGVLTMWATTGSWDTEETVAAIALLSEAALAWLVPNQAAAP